MDVIITDKKDMININSAGVSDSRLITLINKAIIHHSVNVESLQKLFFDEIILPYKNIEMIFDSSIAIQDKKHFSLQGNFFLKEGGVINCYSIHFKVKFIEYSNINKIADDLVVLTKVEIHIPYLSTFEIK